MKLSADNVAMVFAKCLASKKDMGNQENMIMITGVLPNMHIGFNKKALQEHDDDITSLLDHLPSEFKKSGGGGWSFVNACVDKDGNQWGEQSTVNQLLMLGLATGKARYTLPREMWSMLPGGVPYFVVDDVGEQEKEA